MPVWGDGTYSSSASPRCSLQVSPAPAPLKPGPGPRRSEEHSTGGGGLGRWMHFLVPSTTFSYSCGHYYRSGQGYPPAHDILQNASETCPKKCLMAAAAHAPPLPHAHGGFLCARSAPLCKAQIERLCAQSTSHTPCKMAPADFVLWVRQPTAWRWSSSHSSTSL
jgi:hypothetical protein